MERIVYIPGAGWCWSKGYTAAPRYLWRTAMLGYHGVTGLEGRPFSDPWYRMDLLNRMMGGE